LSPQTKKPSHQFGYPAKHSSLGNPATLLRNPADSGGNHFKACRLSAPASRQVWLYRGLICAWYNGRLPNTGASVNHRCSFCFHCQF